MFKAEPVVIAQLVARFGRTILARLLASWRIAAPKRRIFVRRGLGIAV
jgi:hypothetical protein